jgi:hypothetical protein
LRRVTVGFVVAAVAAVVAVAAVLIYYALPVVCTSRYILLAKRSILTKAQVEAQG